MSTDIRIKRIPSKYLVGEFGGYVYNKDGKFYGQVTLSTSESDPPKNVVYIGPFETKDAAIKALNFSIEAAATKVGW